MYSHSTPSNLRIPKLKLMGPLAAVTLHGVQVQHDFSKLIAYEAFCLRGSQLILFLWYGLGFRV